MLNPLAKRLQTRGWKVPNEVRVFVSGTEKEPPGISRLRGSLPTLNFSHHVPTGHQLWSPEIIRPATSKQLLEIPHQPQKLKFLWARTVRYEQSRERS